MTVAEPDVATVDAPSWTISDEVFAEAAALLTDEVVREAAVLVNPFVAIGQSPALNLRSQGWLADLVAKHDWHEAEVKYPEITAFCDRLRETLQGVVAGVIASRR